MIRTLVLAAGAGTRLGGAAKALLRLPDGRSYLDAILALAPAPVVVVAAPFGAEVAAAVAGRAEVVWNPAPERGMIASLLAGLAAVAGADVALVWPVDHPRVTAATVAAVRAAAATDRIVVPVHAGRGGHPTAFGAALFAELRAAATARDVVAADPGRVTRVAVDDPGVIRDVDTPADLLV